MMTYIPSKESIFWDFEDKLENNASDEQLKEILDQLKPEDYVAEDVVFDLIASQRWDILEYLYKKGIPFTYTDEAKANALHMASAISGSLRAVKFLVERNILTDINARTDENETPFLLAIMYEHEDIVEYFLKHFKPDLSIVTDSGDTAYTLAKKSGNKKILAMLKQYASSKE